MLLILLPFAGAGCNRSTKPSATRNATLTIFAAASLTQSFTQIAHEFESQHPGTHVVLNFAGSQQLVEQLIQGAPADVFASADHRQMDRAVSASLVDSDSLADFANNRLIVIVSRKNPNPPQSLADLARKGLRIDAADPVVPVGHYAIEMLDRLAADAQYGPSFKSGFLNNVVSREESVKAVLTKVRLGEADAGVVYTSDTVTVPSQEISTIEVPDVFNPMASYPIAVVTKSAHKDLAKAFEAIVLSPNGQAILQKEGLVPIHHPATHP
ncbi:MAG TPA: molybdate ABC transporter substrate-binding protein [Tepidisphaeraceae bacterium]|nr:molybdate ABC transporter substrate-binding protein [Tepidisphaeraceae bacterium]